MFLPILFRNSHTSSLLFLLATPIIPLELACAKPLRKNVCRTRKSAESALLFAQFCRFWPIPGSDALHFLSLCLQFIEKIAMVSFYAKQRKGRSSGRRLRKHLHTAIRPIIPRILPVSGQPLLFQNYASISLGATFPYRALE